MGNVLQGVGGHRRARLPPAPGPVLLSGLPPSPSSVPPPRPRPLAFPSPQHSSASPSPPPSSAPSSALPVIPPPPPSIPPPLLHPSRKTPSSTPQPPSWTHPPPRTSTPLHPLPKPPSSTPLLHPSTKTPSSTPQPPSWTPPPPPSSTPLFLHPPPNPSSSTPQLPSSTPPLPSSTPLLTHPPPEPPSSNPPPQRLRDALKTYLNMSDLISRATPTPTAPTPIGAPPKPCGYSSPVSSSAPCIAPPPDATPDKAYVKLISFLGSLIPFVLQLLPSLYMLHTGSAEETLKLFGTPAMWAGLISSIFWILYCLVAFRQDRNMSMLMSNILHCLSSFNYLMSVYSHKRHTKKGYILFGLFVVAISALFVVLHWDTLLLEIPLKASSVLALFGVAVCHVVQIVDIVSATRTKAQVTATAINLLPSSLINVATLVITHEQYPDHMIILISCSTGAVFNIIEIVLLFVVAVIGYFLRSRTNMTIDIEGGAGRVSSANSSPAVELTPGASDGYQLVSLNFDRLLEILTLRPFLHRNQYIREFHNAIITDGHVITDGHGRTSIVLHSNNQVEKTCVIFLQWSIGRQITMDSNSLTRALFEETFQRVRVLLCPLAYTPMVQLYSMHVAGKHIFFIRLLGPPVLHLRQPASAYMFGQNGHGCTSIRQYNNNQWSIGGQIITTQFTVDQNSITRALFEETVRRVRVLMRGLTHTPMVQLYSTNVAGQHNFVIRLLGPPLLHLSCQASEDMFGQGQEIFPSRFVELDANTGGNRLKRKRCTE